MLHKLSIINTRKKEIPLLRSAVEERCHSAMADSLWPRPPPQQCLSPPASSSTPFLASSLAPLPPPTLAGLSSSSPPPPAEPRLRFPRGSPWPPRWPQWATPLMPPWTLSRDASCSRTSTPSPLLHDIVAGSNCACPEQCFHHWFVLVFWQVHSSWWERSNCWSRVQI